jgi:ribulose-phosphate 3-epimerase
MSGTDRTPLRLELGLKADPILYRYSYDWLFRLLDEEGVRHVQIGTFFELYQLPDEWFRDLRRRAADHGVAITSVFTAHRELGGFFRDDGPGWVDVARRNFDRLIDIAALLGAASVGSNPGAVLRDRLGTKSTGTACYVRHFKELMKRAGDHGIEWLTIEPMSCLAEPPTLPAEMRAMQAELEAHHRATPGTARPGYCVDVAHGYADAAKSIVCDHWALMTAALPMTAELHLKNTDAVYNATFGFTESDRQRGIIDAAAVRRFYTEHADALPVRTLHAYLEVGGPKLGRDYTDEHLGPMLRESLRHLKEAWCEEPEMEVRAREEDALTLTLSRGTGREDLAAAPAMPRVKIAPSLMCADLLNLERHIERLKAAGAADLLHLDVMDGRFAPNLTLGLTLIEQLRPRTDIPFDVHLMVEEPELLVRELIRIGADRVAVHAEAVTHLDRTLNQLRDAGVAAGVAINPATPLSVLDYVLDSIDFVLVMTVNPGFAGQKLVGSAIRKIADCRRLLDGRAVTIEVDGNVSFANIPLMVAAGADELVAGTSSIFSPADTLTANAAKVREAIAEGLARRAAAPALATA